MSSRKQLKVPQEQNHTLQRTSVAESSGDAQTPVANEADSDANGLYKVNTLNDSQPVVIQRRDSVGHHSIGGASTNSSERLPETHTSASVDV